MPNTRAKTAPSADLTTAPAADDAHPVAMARVEMVVVAVAVDVIRIAALAAPAQVRVPARSANVPAVLAVKATVAVKAVAAAAAVLLLSRAAEGDEEIKNMLVGNILLVTPHEVWNCFALFVAVGVFHFLLRRNFLLVSFDRGAAYEKGLRVRWWDFLFYAVFGLVVTSFVRIAGVLLVFSYLIVPAVCGINLATRISRRLLIGWIIAWLGGIAGLFLSFWWDLPSGAAIVCTFGAILILISFFALWQRRARSGAMQDSQ